MKNAKMCLEIPCIRARSAKCEQGICHLLNREFARRRPGETDDAEETDDARATDQQRLPNAAARIAAQAIVLWITADAGSVSARWDESLTLAEFSWQRDSLSSCQGEPMQHRDVRTNGYPLRHDLTPVHVRIEELKPLGQQTRRHPKLQITKLAASLQEFGFVLPIAVDAERRVVSGWALVAARSRRGAGRHLARSQRGAAPDAATCAQPLERGRPSGFWISIVSSAPMRFKRTAMVGVPA
ncbi:hypothetical protein FXV83_35730 [Bradyrhizobium hipponense]|uniref:ParB/Sulfiredoxin domain-containing protein n=1 Tax=Bradyrhizobium hipponense TaxID=2605638 RepID=A0A5S4YBT1_9BRAD|nr:hypothetical protein [Bradyrhizobium hipponense]TYO61896.1 hypothetical protein FXV83_35730 [Bradyrhizobium hipponense]